MAEGSRQDVLLKLASFVSQLSDLSEEDADFARKSLTEVIEIPAVTDRAM